MAIPVEVDQFAEIWHTRKIGRLLKSGPKGSCQAESADVYHPFLSLRLGRGSRLYRKLKHRCFLTLIERCQENDLRVWKF
jgi:hypothetical protein